MQNMRFPVSQKQANYILVCTMLMQLPAQTNPHEYHTAK